MRERDGVIPREVVARILPEDVRPARVARDFRALLREGVEIRPAGTAKRSPKRLLEEGYLPRHRFRLFDTSFYLTDVAAESRHPFLHCLFASGRREGALSAHLLQGCVADLALGLALHPR